MKYARECFFYRVCSFESHHARHLSRSGFSLVAQPTGARIYLALRDTDSQHAVIREAARERRRDAKPRE